MRAISDLSPHGRTATRIILRHRRTVVVLGAFVILGGVVLATVRERVGLRLLLLPLWVQTSSDLPYGPHADQRLDILRPRWKAARGFRPAVMVFHGGGWSTDCRRDVLDSVCRRYLEQGFLVVNVEYRRGAIQAAADDAVRALRWFVGNAASYGADRSRVVITGQSAGAHLALLTAFRADERVAAVINFYGPSDLTALAHRQTYRAVLPPSDWKAAARRLSPLTYVCAGLPPLFSIHGTADEIVPPEQTARLTSAIRGVGGEASVLYIEGGVHGLSASQQETAYRAVFSFLRRCGVMTD